MTRTVDGTVVIFREGEQQCDLCGLVAELRPYGPQGEMICAPCGLKNVEATERQMGKHL